jgi:hypothetical protein
VIGCGARNAGIARVDVTPDTVFIHRNGKPLSTGFRIDEPTPMRGKQLVLI